MVPIFFVCLFVFEKRRKSSRWLTVRQSGMRKHSWALAPMLISETPPLLKRVKKTVITGLTRRWKPANPVRYRLVFGVYSRSWRDVTGASRCRAVSEKLRHDSEMCLDSLSVTNRSRGHHPSADMVRVLWRDWHVHGITSVVYSDRPAVFFFPFSFATGYRGGKKTFTKRNRLFKRLKSWMVAFWSFSLCVCLFLLQSQNHPCSCQSNLSLNCENESDYACAQNP